MAHKFLICPVVLAAFFPVTAFAACDPSFVEGSTIVNLIPNASLDDQKLVERFDVRIQNDGNEPCTLRLAVGQEQTATANRFPAYSLTGPTGNETHSGLADFSDNFGFGTEFIVQANGQVSIPYEIRMAIGWGSKAGLYNKDLLFQLLDALDGTAIERQRAQLSLTIPQAAYIRFAGASGADGPAIIDMGSISSTGPTRSPPFALRILSTAAYRIDLASQNGGALHRFNGSEKIPYRMTVGGREMNLRIANGSIQVGRHTSSLGDVHPVAIVIYPDPTYRAGKYNDRVTVTVTTI